MGEVGVARARAVLLRHDPAAVAVFARPYDVVLHMADRPALGRAQCPLLPETEAVAPHVLCDQPLFGVRDPQVLTQVRSGSREVAAAVEV